MSKTIGALPNEPNPQSSDLIILETAAGTRHATILSLGQQFARIVGTNNMTGVQNFAGTVSMQAQNELHFADADSSNFVGFKANAVIPTNVIWTLPAMDGSNNQVLTTNGAGVLGWTTPAVSGVTSVDVSGGTTGLTTSGGPITASGTVTLAGTLALAHGGTGATTQAAAANAVLPSQATNAGMYLTTDGTNVSWVALSGSSTPGALTFGTYLSGTAASFNGATAVTVSVDATSANTVSKVVARDASGNFSAGTITATLSGLASNVNWSGVLSPPTTLSGYGITDAINSSQINANNGVAGLDATGFVPIAHGGTGFGTAADAINALVPTQTGNSGKFLTTNGSLVSWGAAAGGGTPAGTALTQIPSASSDPNFSSVSSLLLLNGINGSTTITDEKGKAWTANGNASISTAQSKFDGASAFLDGNGDYLSTPDHADFAFGAGDFTVELWIYMPTGSSGGDLITKRAAGGFGPWGIIISPTSLFTFASTSGSSWALLKNDAASISLDAWHHIALVRNGTSWMHFLDGVQIGTTGTVSGSLFVDANPVHIGFNDGNAWFNGYVDEVRITKGIARYTTNFSVPTTSFGAAGDPSYTNVQALLHFDGTNGSNVFTDTKGHTFTAAGAALSTAQAKWGTASLHVGGASSYIDSTSNDFLISGDFTLEAWVMSPSARGTLCTIGSTNTAGSFFLAWEDANTTYVRFGGAGGVVAGLGVGILNNAWHHIAVSRASGTVRLFADGTQIASFVDSSTITQNTLAIGGTYAAAGVDRYVDDFRLTVGVARYTANFAVPTTEFPVGAFIPDIIGSVQYNNNSTFGGDAGFIWDSTNGRLGVNDSIYPTETLDINGNIKLKTIGNGLKIKEGTNARMGVATLAAGTITVNNSSVTANSRIFLTSQVDGGTPGWLRVSARVAGTSFTITSSSNTDTSEVAWLIIEGV